MEGKHSKRLFKPNNSKFRKHGQPNNFYKKSRSSPKVNRLNLPIHIKRPTKMSSPKRSSSELCSERPTKLQKLDDQPALTGLEDLDVLGETEKAVPAAVSASAEVRYCRRARKGLSKRQLSDKVRGDWRRMPSSARKGLANLTGSLCYRSSLLQALLHSPKFANWLVDVHQPGDCLGDKASCVACTLRCLVQAYWTDQPVALRRAYSSVDQIFRVNDWRAVDGDPDGQGDPEDQFTWMRKVLSESLPGGVYQLFEATNTMVTNSCIKCKNCGHISVTEGHSTSPLSLPLRPRAPKGQLSEYLRRYMEETISDYKCEKCADKKEKLRYQEITHSPDNLLVQLKRFDYDGRKDSSPVLFEASLDLNDYRAPGNADSSVYSLSAVVLHSGGVNSGHYRCVAKGEDGQWKDFDDQRVTNISTKIALDPRGGGVRFTPYLLFFQRTLS